MKHKRRSGSHQHHQGQVSPQIQETIGFLNRNLLDTQTETDLLHKAKGRFDLICCRNLLVYFTKPQRENLLQTIQRLLKPDGELVVGAAEAFILPTGTWEPTGSNPRSTQTGQRITTNTAGRNSESR